MRHLVVRCNRVGAALQGDLGACISHDAHVHDRNRALVADARVKTARRSRLAQELLHLLGRRACRRRAMLVWRRLSSVGPPELAALCRLLPRSRRTHPQVIVVGKTGAFKRRTSANADEPLNQSGAAITHVGNRGRVASANKNQSRGVFASYRAHLFPAWMTDVSSSSYLYESAPA
jgi:hypothetical protein